MGLSVNQPTRVSIVVPTRDRPLLLAQCLRSIRALEGQDLALEILVGDNGSQAETRVIAEAHGARYLPVPRPGASAARNVCLNAATGEYVAFLDDDDLWLPGHLRPHLKLLATRADVGGVVGQVVNTDMQGTPLLDPWPSELPADGDYLVAFMGYAPQLGATVVRAAVRSSVGGFDEELPGGEDWDWHLRLATRHRMGFVAQPCVLFRQRPAGSYDALQEVRIPYTQRVFWRHARAAWRRGTGWRLLRGYNCIMGTYTTYFVSAATARYQAGEHGEALRAIARSLRLVPLSTLHRLLTSSALRRTLVRAALGAGPEPV